jgi:peptidoglycan/LPS O-acetylase OafA/YrhL
MLKEAAVPSPDASSVPSNGHASSREGRAPQHMPQLDALRAFAVGGVLLTHFWGLNRLPFHLGILDWGFLGVRLFFVLSGFLITGILLRCRDMADTTSGSRWFFVRQFYLRRFLRIFPIYYLVILLAIVVNFQPARAIILWLVTYSLNAYISLRHQWSPVGHFGHFWSLAVEEQFYIVWPCLILFARRKWLIALAFCGIILAPAYRLFVFSHHLASIEINTFTLGNMDTIAMGALLALACHSEFSRQDIERILKLVVFPVGVAGMALIFILLYNHISSMPYAVLYDSTAGLVFCYIVGFASWGFRGAAGAVLNSRPLIYIGKISYGIYVYHAFMPVIVSHVVSLFGVKYQQVGALNFVCCSIAVVVVAAASWHLLERPINDLKRFLPYVPSPKVAERESVAVEG